MFRMPRHYCDRSSKGSRQPHQICDYECERTAQGLVLVSIEVNSIDNAAGRNGVRVEERTPCGLTHLPDRLREAARSGISPREFRANGAARVVELRRRNEKNRRYRHTRFDGRGAHCVDEFI